MASLWAAEPARRVLDAFLLREPEKVAGSRSALQQENTARYFAAGERRVRAAAELPHADAVAALVLYREAAVFYIAALGQSSSAEKVDPAATVSEAWKRLDEHALPPNLASPPDAMTKARELLASDDPLVADGMSPADLVGATAAAAETLRWLASAVEPRTPSEIRGSRRMRLSGAAVVAALALYWIGGAVLAPKNLALHKPALASSQRPGSPVPADVVNGEFESTYGLLTNAESNPWVRIDLGASMPIHEVKVYNRADFHEYEIIPLLLQLSDDGDIYDDVAERTEVFTRKDPWVVELKHQHARYVRILMPKQGFIALTEIEVY